MEIIGATINTSESETIIEILEKRDKERLLKLADYQIKLGAEMLDLNAGDRIKTEKDDIVWMMKTIQREFEVPISIDTPDAEVIRSGLDCHENSYGRPLVNSVSGERERLDNILPLVEEYDVPVVGLLMDEEGIPDTAEGRLEIADMIIAEMKEYHIPDEDIYLDPLIFPVAVDGDNGKISLETVSLIKEKYPEVKTICGLNNISHGLPAREMINGTYIAMLAATGMDSFLVEMTEVSSAVLKTAEMLLGNDRMCMDFLSAYREGVLDIYQDGAEEAIVEDTKEEG
ncbi:MAG: dihydropteroate synthase [Bacillota bacterium]